jgi:hypothetical protein
MVFLASHIVCARLSSLQYFLLRILNDPSIESAQAVKLKARSLEPLLERCKDSTFVTALLHQEKQIDPIDFRKLLVEIVGPGSNIGEISLLLDLVGMHGPLSGVGCQQLSTVFPFAGQTMQLQIAKLLMNLLESGPTSLSKAAAMTLDSIDLPSTVILSILDDLRIEVDSRDSSPARKRQRTDSERSSPETLSEALMQSARRLTLFLEVLERQTSEPHINVVAPLFGVLDRLMAASDTPASLSYPKQMVLSCLLSIVRGLKVRNCISSFIVEYRRVR